MAELEVRARFTASVKDAIASMRQLEHQANSLDKSVSASGGGLTKMLGSFAKIGTLGVAALGSMGAAAGMMGLKTAAANEQALISFETLLGSATKAQKMFDDLNKFAASTPFEFPQLRDAASKLLTTGVEASRVIPIMTALGDATSAMGTGAEGIGRAVYALQQMNTAGKVTGQDMMQLASSGIPIWDALAASIGMSVPEVRKLASEGKLVANDVMTAIETYAGPAMTKVKGMMEVQSKSMIGLMSTLKDTIAIELGKMMAPAAEGLKTMLPDLIALVGTTLTAIGPTINKLVLNIFTLFQKLLPLLTPVMIAVGELVGVMLMVVQAAVEAIMPHIGKIAPMFTAIGNIVRNLVPVFTSLASILIASVLPVFVSIVDVVGKLTDFIGKNETVLKLLPPVLGLIVAGLVAYKIAMGAIELAAFIAKLGLQFHAIMLSVGAQGLLNTVTMLFPGIWIALAIAAVIAAAILLWKNWDKVVAGLKKAWNFLVSVIEGAINLVLKYYSWWINKLIDGVNLLIKAWNKLPFGDDIKPLDHINMQISLAGAKIKEVAKGATAASLAFGSSADAAQRMADKTAAAAHVQQLAIAAMYKAAGVTGGFGQTATGVEEQKNKFAGTGDGGAPKITEAAKKAKKHLDELKKSMDQVRDAGISFAQNVGAAIKDALGVKTPFSADKASASLASFRDAMNSAKQITSGLAQKFKAMADTMGKDMVDALNAAKTALDDAISKFNSFKDDVAGNLVKAFGTLADVFGTQKTATENYTKAQKDSADAAAKITDLLDVEKKAREAITKIMDNERGVDPDALASAQERLAEAVANTAEATAVLSKAKTDEMAASGEAAKTFLDRLKEQAAAGTKFTNQIKKLIEMGLSETALQSVLSAGNEAGTAIATQLIDGGQTLIDDTNRLIDSAKGAADKVAQMAAVKWYQAGVDQATAQVNGLVDQIQNLQPMLEALMDELAERMNREAVIAIKVIGPDGKEFDLSVFGNDWTKIFGDLTNLVVPTGGGNGGSGTMANPLASFGPSGSLEEFLLNSSTWNESMFAGWGGALMANGGLVTKPTNAIIGEAGPEAVIPLSRLGDFGGSSYNIVVNAGMGANGSDIGDEIVNALKRYERRNGALPLRVF